eukprot:13587120-Heterocapsa_arctica.AAC.1
MDPFLAKGTCAWVSLGRGGVPPYLLARMVHADMGHQGKGRLDTSSEPPDTEDDHGHRPYATSCGQDLDHGGCRQDHKVRQLLKG